MENTTKPSQARLVFAKNVRLARRLRNLTQESLALEASMSRTYVSEVERGARNISIDSMAMLAEALDVPLAKLVDPVGFDYIKL
ncbi:helix-turn-helix transcriptional regulator [Chitinibacter fontanus]|uniref:Helix-turn-helix transcriptional regulator n=1 Tax=Chitinibacter fontanus TaxID=1737446 RepID=A0A7D5ZFI2_9NEIS|nr:helix-turn-helix transcriptional regulator [Chitinibacter fontanus]QLI82666.1 helix-turn-helix transcriptional regulator [Chitinibacter fontanus]